MVEVRPLRGLLAGQLHSWRLGAALLSAFGVLALLVAAAGIYSVLSFDVVQRRFELGVRAALGGSPLALVRACMQRALLICGGGIVAGMLVAYALAHLAATLLFHVSAFDPTIYVAALAALATATLISASLPAWRAVQADPRDALRAE